MKNDKKEEKRDDYLHIMYEQNTYCTIKGILVFLFSLVLLGIQLELYYLPKYFDILSSSSIWKGISLQEYYDEPSITLLFWFATFISLLLMVMGIKIFNKGNK